MANEYVAKWEVDEDTPAPLTLPTVEQLAHTLGISRDSLYERKEFSDILERLKQVQAHLLINKGLIGDYNSTIAKLLLSSKHGYVEKTEVQRTDNPLKILLEAYNVKPTEGSDARQTDEPVQGPPEGTPQP